MSDKPTTAELITMLSEFNCHADVQKLASDRLEAAEINANELSDMRDIISELNTEIRAYWERSITAEVTVTALEDEKAELVKGINSAMDYANGRQCEWGERAIRCFEILDELLSKQEQE